MVDLQFTASLGLMNGTIATTFAIPLTYFCSTTLLSHL